MPSSPTRVRFTKMHGAGNDFVVLDALRAPLTLAPDQLRRLGDRRFGVGADQILVVAPPGRPGVDFTYRIFNNTGDEVEHCGNGARCFARYVREHGLFARDTIRVETVNNTLELEIEADGRVRVDMNVPRFEPAALPFDPTGLVPRREGAGEAWPLDLGEGRSLEIVALSMGNPHAVHRLPEGVDVWREAPVGDLGPRIEHHPRFARKVNAGFVQLLARDRIALRVHERDAGETYSCGTGACAAVVAGIRGGWLDSRVDVTTRGGTLTVRWAGGADDRVFLTGPATTVFEGEIDL
ncbi:MAG TPA: diaminopimelate epimerase [Burkholderiaceae bacterium]|nr:diaminopimelate epimerase [Burkholderiaceae bacterium]